MSPECRALRERAASVDAYSTAKVGALRREFDKDLVHAALSLARARVKARAKFGDLAGALVCDPQGVEMASSALSADWKARRFAALSPRPGLVLDLCCGMGGDAMALAGAGLRVLAVDADPPRAWMAGENLRGRGGEARAGDAGDASLPDGPFHLDPARREARAGGKRSLKLEDMTPGVDAIRAIIARRGDGAIKLAPGVDHADLASVGLMEGPREIEYISEQGRLTQAVVWCGAMARAKPRTATMLWEGRNPQSISGEADGPGSIPVAPLARYLHEVDDCVERAGLLGVLGAEVGAPMIHPRLGLFTSDSALAERGFLRSFEVLEHCKWNEQRVEALLRKHGAGSVEVKTRAKVVKPDELQPSLQRSACVRGGVPLVLFVLRFDGERTSEVRAIVARRQEALGSRH
jgi:SAM-dependent methyltransferase